MRRVRGLAVYFAWRKGCERMLYLQFRRSLPRSGRSITTAVSVMALLGFVPPCGRRDVAPAAAGSNGRRVGMASVHHGVAPSGSHQR